MIDKEFAKVLGEPMALRRAKLEIAYKVRDFLDECEIKVEDCGDAKRYSFDFWIE